MSADILAKSAITGYDSLSRTILSDEERIKKFNDAYRNGYRFSNENPAYLNRSINTNPRYHETVIRDFLKNNPSYNVLITFIEKGLKLDYLWSIAYYEDIGTATPLAYLIYRRYQNIRGEHPISGNAKVDDLNNTINILQLFLRYGGSKRLADKINFLGKRYSTPAFAYVVDPEIMQIFLANGIFSYFNEYYFKPEIINLILDNFGDNFIDGRHHIVLFLLSAIKDLKDILDGPIESIKRKKILNNFLDILEARGFDERTPLDATGRTLVMELADTLNSTGNISKELGMAYPEKNIYGRSAAFYKRLANSQKARRPPSRGGKYSSRKITRRRR